MSDLEDEERFPIYWEEEALAAQATAFDVLDMVLAFGQWVHRRKECAEIVSETRVQWRCSLDFTLPAMQGRGNNSVNVESNVLVPLDLLSKQPMVSFDSRDGSGCPVPILTQRQNGILTNSAMAHWAQAITEATDTSLSEKTRIAIAQITQGEERRAHALVEELVASEREDARALAGDGGFMAMLETLAHNFVLIAMLDVRPGDRSVVKYTYERQLKRVWRPWKERMAIQPTMLDFPVPMFRDCESYHFEAVAPIGTNFSAVQLFDSTLSAQGVPPLEVIDLRKSAPHVAHLNLSSTSLRETAGNAPDPDTFAEPTVRLATELDRSAWLRSALMVSVLVAAFMTVTLPWILIWESESSGWGWCFPEGIDAGDTRCVFGAAGGGERSDLVPLFVGLVGLLSFVVVRQGEHAYTAKLVRPLRNLAWATSLLPLAGAWLIVFPGPGNVTRLGWVALVVLACAGAAVLAAAYRPTGDAALSLESGTVE